MEKQNTKKENKVWLGEDGIIYVETSILTEETTPKLISDLKEKLETIQNKEERKVLVDLSAINSYVTTSSFRRDTVDRIKNVAEKVGFYKTAVFGGNTFIRTIASFMLAYLRKENVKIFKSKEEALKWLEE